MNGSVSQNPNPSDYRANSAPFPNSPFSSIISLLDSDDSDDNAAHALTNNVVNYGNPSSQLPVGQDHGASGYTTESQEPTLASAENGPSQSDFNEFMKMLEMI